MQSPVNWALLGVVIERPSYAYELAQRFDRTYDGALSLSSTSHVYTALAALEERGLIEEVPGSGTGRQPKPCYRASDGAIEQYQRWLVCQLSEERRRQRLFAMELAALMSDPDLARGVIDGYEQACVQEGAEQPVACGERRQRGRRLAARGAARLRAEPAGRRGQAAVGSVRAPRAASARAAQGAADDEPARAGGCRQALRRPGTRTGGAVRGLARPRGGGARRGMGPEGLGALDAVARRGGHRGARQRHGPLRRPRPGRARRGSPRRRGRLLRAHVSFCRRSGRARSRHRRPAGARRSHRARRGCELSVRLRASMPSGPRHGRWRRSTRARACASRSPARSRWNRRCW